HIKLKGAIDTDFDFIIKDLSYYSYYYDISIQYGTKAAGAKFGFRKEYSFLHENAFNSIDNQLFPHGELSNIYIEVWGLNQVDLVDIFRE
ncbi:MAG: hypothetical protein ACP5FZ_12680, partial [Fidelibacterota bacterium]